MNSLTTSLGLLGALAAACTGALAQTGGGGQVPSEQTPVSGWRTSCAAAERAGPLDCALEQRAFVAQTGQLLVRVTVRVDGKERKPALMIQLPLGLHLPAGVELRIDEHKPEPLGLQMCDAAGCYAGMALSDAFLARLNGGRQLLISFEDPSKRRVNVTMPLQGFSEGLKKVR
jgi:invasion protein IalB